MTASTQAATNASCWPSRSSSAGGASGRAPPGGASHSGAPRGDAALSRSPLQVSRSHAAIVTLADIRGRPAHRWRIIGSRRVRVPARRSPLHHQGATAVPTYQYACTNPEGKHEFEVVQSFSDAPVTECPECGAPVRKVYGSVGVVFKGSGFYRTDSRKAASSPESSSSTSTKETSAAPAASASAPSSTAASSSAGSSSSSSSGGTGSKAAN